MPDTRGPIDTGGPVCDADTLADLEDAFGRPRLLLLLAGLRAEIDTRLQSTADRERLTRDAHALVSVSGTLGFVALSRACAWLERAGLNGDDMDAPLEAARSAADAARAALDDRLAAS